MPTLFSSPLTGETLWQQSWERCRALGAELSHEPRDLSQADLRQLLEQQHGLLHHSTATLTELAGLVRPHHGLVLLCDAQGTVLQQAGDPHFLQRADQVALRAGVSWAEHHRGTNAIGTALVTGQAVRIHGQQHYLPGNRILSCHGAPIRDPYGHIVGVLDISGPADLEHSYALDMARLYARQISRQMLDALCTPQRRLLHLHTDPSLLEGPYSGRLVIQDDLIVAADEVAAALLGRDWRTLPGLDLKAALEHAQSMRGPNALHVRPSAESPRPPPSPCATQPQASRLSTQQQHALEPALRALQMGLSVLLSGESGAGKERMARELHQRHRPLPGPFVAINCGALPESLIEAELFGYEAGAFTGARRQGYIGKLRQADGGVLFLDEIGDMPMPLQSRLLRVLQEREVQALGSERTHALNFRLISASHQSLENLVRQGRFRADLFFRLQDYICAVPALRERPDLGEYIRSELVRLSQDRPAPHLSDDAVLSLQSYRWPGNYRQLRSVLLQIILQDRPGLVWTAAALPVLPLLDPWAEDHPIPCPAPLPPPWAGASQREREQAALRAALDVHKGNISKAARMLGLHRSTVHRRLKEMDSLTAGGRRPGSPE